MFHFWLLSVVSLFDDFHLARPQKAIVCYAVRPDIPIFTNIPRPSEFRFSQVLDRPERLSLDHPFCLYYLTLQPAPMWGCGGQVRS
jgi:hypothetical protein